MGFTPVAGLVMGTRAGDLDLGALLYICEKEGLDLPKANNLINKKSGVQGISGVSSDFRELQAAMEKGNEKAALALDVFCYNVKKYIGAYAAVLNGVDLIIFTGGIGENDNLVRWETCKNMDYLGIQEYEIAIGATYKTACDRYGYSKIELILRYIPFLPLLLIGSGGSF